MHMTSADLQVVYRQLHQNVAKRLGIEDFEWKPTHESADEIQRRNRQAASKPEEFIKAYKAYEDWFEVHEQIEASRSFGNLSADQKTRWINAIAVRDSTRNALLDRLAGH